MAEKRKDSKGRNLNRGESQRASDGRYSFRYIDRYGKRKEVTAMDLKQLRKMEKSILDDLEDDVDIEASLQTVNEYFEKFLATKPDKKVRESTRSNYKYMYKTFVQDSKLGQMALKDVRHSDIKVLYSKLSKDGMKNGTIAIIQNLLFPCFQMALKDNIIRFNPCLDAMKDFPLKADARKKVAMTVEQQNKFLEYALNNTYYKHLHPMLVFMIGTGCRCGEVIGLTWNDVNFKDFEISVNHQLTYRDIDGERCFRSSTPKTKDGCRTIPMTPEVFEALKTQRKQQFALGVFNNPEVAGYRDFVFTTFDGSPIHPSNINNALKNIINAYNRDEEKSAEKEKRDAILLPHISCHTLRHTGCTRMAESGLDPKALQIIMGHSNINVTMDVYNHVDKDRLKREIAKAKIFKRA